MEFKSLRFAVPFAILLSAVQAGRAEPAESGSFGEHVGGCLGDRAGPEGPWLWRGGWCTTFFLLAAGVSTEVFLDPPDEPRWTARNGFDESARRALRGDSHGSRDGYATASDALLATMFVAPHVDALAYTLTLPERAAPGDDVRWRVFELMEQTNLNFQLANITATAIAKAGSARPRPYVRQCATDPGYAGGCGDPSAENQSFWSGHASNAFTGAGLVCARHARFEYGGSIDDAPTWGWDDTAACAGALAAAAGTAVLRISADEHYATDVLAGALSGFAFGFLAPYLWEREAWGPRKEGASSWLVLPMAQANGGGVVAVVRF